jgi:hypothetical protein
MVNSAAKFFRPAFMVVCAGILMGAPMGLSVAAQDAMRAPLNIVPPAMQEAIGQPVGQRTGRNAKSDKLAPRVAARQSKRAVRAVAAAPGSETGIVQVGQLGALQDAPIGLESGYGSNLWRGARLAFIAGQMARLPRDLSLAALRDAELTLHRSTTAAPVGTVDGGSWYAARLNRFLALGDTGSVLQLEALTGAVSGDPYAARAIVLAHLGRGDGAAACAVSAPKRGTRGYADTLPFFMQLMVYCQLRAGEFEKAGLTLQLNEKSLGADRFYRELAFLMAAQTQAEFGTVADVAAAKAAETEPPLVVPSVLTPMQLALLQLAGYGLTEGLDQVPPYFMQSLAEDYAQPPATQLGAALAAMRHGSLSAERFSQLSQLSDLTAFQNPAEADAALNTPPPDAVFLALRLLEVDAQPINAQPSALVNALAQAQSRGLWRDMVLLLDDRLRNLQAASDGANAAPAFPADAPLAPFAPAFEAENGTDETGPGIEAAAQADRTYGDALHAALLPAMQLLAWADALSADSSAPADVLSAAPAALSFTPSAMAERILQFGDMPQTLGDLIAALADEPIFDEALSGDTDGSDISDVTEIADTRPHPIADWQAFEAQYGAATPALRAYLTRELAVYEGLGFDIPAAYSAAPSDGALDADALRIQKLADNKWVGDLVLALVDLYGEENAATLENAELVALLGYLRTAALDAPATALAEEILLAAAGRLSLIEPSAFIAPPILSFDETGPADILAASGALSVQP